MAETRLAVGRPRMAVTATAVAEAPNSIVHKMNLPDLRSLTKAAAITAALVAAVVMLYPIAKGDRRSSSEMEFEAFFKNAVYLQHVEINRAKGIHLTSEHVNRFPSKFSVCIYGEEAANPRIKARITDFFKFIGENSWLRPDLIFNDGALMECSDKTWLYVRTHDGNAKIFSSIIGDLSFISERHNLKGGNVELGKYGIGVWVVEPGPKSITYVAINGAIDETTEIGAQIARNVVQQELVQLILGAPDISVDRAPRSILEEREPKTDTTDRSDFERLSERAKVNVPNMCLYDIMAVITLYANDLSIEDGTISNYVAYIRKNYSYIEKTAQEIQNNPRYKAIFYRKC